MAYDNGVLDKKVFKQVRFTDVEGKFAWRFHFEPDKERVEEPKPEIKVEVKPVVVVVPEVKVSKKKK